MCEKQTNFDEKKPEENCVLENLKRLIFHFTIPFNIALIYRWFEHVWKLCHTRTIYILSIFCIFKLIMFSHFLNNFSGVFHSLCRCLFVQSRSYSQNDHISCESWREESSYPRSVGRKSKIVQFSSPHTNLFHSNLKLFLLITFLSHSSRRHEGGSLDRVVLQREKSDFSLQFYVKQHPINFLLWQCAL